MNGNQLRQAFIDYFISKGHKHVRSSPCVPQNDNTILFTNAGMNQFKDYFLNNETPKFLRAVTSQKVIRAGGKHNDLENVGRTPRHHTFFEMLGNFSFGDYFKEDAIHFAWEFLTGVLKISSERLAISIFHEDEEAYQIWHEQIGIPENRIARLGMKDNFWQMGDVGPCGPCSEIHYDLHPQDSSKTPKESLEAEEDRFLEIWNLVFMQYNKQESGELQPLPKPSIDTGMGIERILSVLQNKTSNFETDFFTEILDRIASKAGYRLGEDEEKDVSCKVIADHIRSISFLLADGVMPGNEGRGYVLRRIIRRASGHARNLGLETGDLSALAPDFIQEMCETYPELEENREHIQRTLLREEKQFHHILHNGMQLLDRTIEENLKKGIRKIPGEETFKIYDTFGFPPELAKDILEDKKLEWDEAGFQTAMEEQKNRAKAAQEGLRLNKVVKAIYPELKRELPEQVFAAYEKKETKTRILALVQGEKRVDACKIGDSVELILEETPFYAESGGQVGDIGEIAGEDFKLSVQGTFRPVSGLTVCEAKVIQASDGEFRPNSEIRVNAKIDVARREALERNHTATHLMHSALRLILGDHVKQAGSLVEANRLRFDFNHYMAIDTSQLEEIETEVNRWISENEPVSAEEMSYDQALKTGALAFFGEKYGDSVRVITAGRHSKELCGGTHTDRTGNIAFFKIVSEGSVSAGVRRIEAVTGISALRKVQENAKALSSAAKRLKGSPENLEEKIDGLLKQLKDRENRQENLLKLLVARELKNTEGQKQKVGEFDFLALEVSPQIEIANYAKEAKKILKSAVLLLHQKTSDAQGAVILLKSEDLKNNVHVGNLLKAHAEIICGKGGGKPDFARCGATRLEKISEFASAVLEDLKK